MRVLVLLLAGCIPVYGTGGDGDGDGDGDFDPDVDAGPPDACVPHTCLDIGFSCGPADDGCGGELDCGGCEAPLSCGSEEHVCICQFATETVDAAAGPLDLGRGPDGALHILYAAGDPGALHHAWREPGGAWQLEPVPEAGAVDRRVRAELGSDGDVHAAFFDDARGLVYAHRTAAGTWTAEVVASDAEATADLTLDSAGGVHISYTTSDDVRLASRAAGDLAFAVDIVRAANPDRDTAVAADAGGTLHVIYVLFFGGDILHASRAPNAGEWTVETVAEVRGHDFDLAVDAGDGLHLVYLTGSVHYAAAPTGAGWSTETIGSDAGAAALAVTPDGQPHVVSARDQGGALYLSRDPAGRWIDEPLGDRADAAGIALDPAGLADIALSVNEPAILHAAWPCPQ
jgi:hypothetical protein